MRGIIVAGTYTVHSCLGISIGRTSWTSRPIAGVARAAQTAVTSLLLKQPTWSRYCRSHE